MSNTEFQYLNGVRSADKNGNAMNFYIPEPARSTGGALMIQGTAEMGLNGVTSAIQTQLYSRWQTSKRCVRPVKARLSVAGRACVGAATSQPAAGPPGVMGRGARLLALHS